MNPHVNNLTGEIIGAAIEVHKYLGPGLLESSYRECLCRELALRNLRFQREQPLALEYKGIKPACGYRVDIVVADLVLVECKTVDTLAPIHEAQLLTYLRLGGWRVGLLMNFNAVVLKDGIKRRIVGYNN